MNPSTTPNLDHVSTTDAIRRGKRYGKAHGYEGAVGGWIYGPTNPRPLCQGWAAFFTRSRRTIEAWEAAQAAAKAGTAHVAAPAARYEVRVTRDSITRATILDAEGARQTVHDAVHLGYPVSCRLLAANDKGFPGVREVANVATGRKLA